MRGVAAGASASPYLGIPDHPYHSHVLPPARPCKAFQTFGDHCQWLKSPNRTEDKSLGIWGHLVTSHCWQPSLRVFASNSSEYTRTCSFNKQLRAMGLHRLNRWLMYICPHCPMRWWHSISVCVSSICPRSVLSVREDGADKNKLKGAHYPKRTETWKSFSESTYLKWRPEWHIINSGKGLIGTSCKMKLLLKLVSLNKM